MTAPDPIVGIIFRRDEHRAAKGFADLLDEKTLSQVLCDEHVPLSEALTRSWDEDAHLILYSIADEDGDEIYARAAKRSPFAADLMKHGGTIFVSVLVFDHDLPKDQGGVKQEWSEEGLGEFVQGLAGAGLPSPTYWYTTLHGSRFIYVLTQPVDHLSAEGLSRSILAQFKSAGLQLDESCKDWTRLFRLPRTVRSDTGVTFADDPHFMFLGEGNPLDPSTIPSTPVEAEVYADVQPYEGDMPNADDVRELLTRRGENGREYQSDWVKEAKTYLQGRESYAVCFEDGLIDTSAGWNNGVVTIAGQIVGMTARLETASPEGIFALLYGALEQLQIAEEEGANATHWLPKAWDIICRMWANEQAQIAVENKEREEKIIVAKGVREDLIGIFKAELPTVVPDDAEAAHEWLKQRMIASDGRHHYVMRPDGSYNINAVSDSMLVPMIRELGMEDVIETYEMRGKAWAPKSSQSILNESATPIIAVRCSARAKIANIDGDAGYRTLHMPVHRLNPKVKPIRAPHIEEWLRVFFGSKHELGVEWLSWALEVSAPICALNLYGAPGTGKGMLAQGLAECFEGEQINDSRILSSRFNIGLAYSPVVNCDEGLPKMVAVGTTSVDQAFRSYVSGGNLSLEGKGTNPINANIYPRIIFTSNDRDILRSIVGQRDLTDDDIRAIETRLLSLKIDHAAREYLSSRGNYRYTSGWIHGKVHSRYELASHIRWLFENRKPTQTGSGRLLVEGEVETTLVHAMRLRTQASQAVLKALVKMIEAPSAARRGVSVATNGHVWVTPSGVVDYIDSALSGISEKVSLNKAGSVLRQFAAQDADGRSPKIKPPGADRGRWIELDLAVIFEEGLRYGMSCERIETLLRNQPDGDNQANRALAHHGQDE